MDTNKNSSSLIRLETNNHMESLNYEEVKKLHFAWNYTFFTDAWTILLYQEKKNKKKDVHSAFCDLCVLVQLDLLAMSWDFSPQEVLVCA
jgi:hypothetical protein